MVYRACSPFHDGAHAVLQAVQKFYTQMEQGAQVVYTVTKPEQGACSL